MADQTVQPDVILQTILDYASGDLAVSEVLTALAEELPNSVRFMPTTAIESFDTIATGFCVAQLGCRPAKIGKRTVLFANCAPRLDDLQGRLDNAGEGLVYAQLVNGAELLVVHSGYSLSFVKPHIVRLYETTASRSGSQFRSRCNFPPLIANCILNTVIGSPASPYNFLTNQIDPQTIPDAPDQIVAYVDSFGNIKTSIRPGSPCLENLEIGMKVRVVVGTTIRTATVTDGSFKVPQGELAFATGSSGFDRPFYELFKRGGRAIAEFGNVPTGTRVEILKAA